MNILKRNHLIVAVLLFALSGYNRVHANERETVYIQTDRTAYVSGETVYYKLYVLDSESKKRSEINKVGYIELRAPKSNPLLKIRVNIIAGFACGSFILPDTLQSSVYQIVAFTSFMKNFDENLFSHQEVVITNRNDKELNFETYLFDSKESHLNLGTDTILRIKTDKRIYSGREKVVVSLVQTASNANVAISVYEEPQLPTSEITIVESLNGLTNAPRNQSKNYLAENSGKILRGRVIDANNKQGIERAIVLLSCPDTVANLQYATSGSEGLFMFQLSSYYDGKELFFTINDVPSDRKWKIELEDPFALTNKWKPECKSEKGFSKEYITKSQDMAYINKTYDTNNVDAIKMQPTGKPVSPLLYRCRVKPVYPSEFVPLDSFPEIAVEILPSVRINMQDGNYQAHIVTRLQHYFIYSEPALFLDGVYLDDINKIIPLNSERIKKIEVLDNKRAFGDLIFNGIISIVSTSNEILATVPAGQSLRMRNDQTNYGKRFVTEDYSSPDIVDTPLFKQLLYWNPQVDLLQNQQKDLEFYTSDNTAKFVIKLEGIADDGTPMSARANIQVNNLNNETAK